MNQASSDNRTATKKSAAAFRTISEVARELDLQQHVLRFWETKFSQVAPMKHNGGRRYYRPEDIAQLRRIRDLLHKEGYTIKGVQKLLNDQASGATSAQPNSAGPMTQQKAGELRGIIAELDDLKTLLAQT